MDFVRPSKQDLTTQTLFAELLDHVKIFEASRSLGHVPGTFVTKTIKGIPYYYFQASIPGGETRQAYIGKQSPTLDRVAAQFAAEKSSLATEEKDMQRLCAQLRTGGAISTEASAVRVLEALSDTGLFHAGGVLVGTHAMAVFGNLLGARWASGALRTQDIDVAFPAVEVAVPNHAGDLPTALERLKMGFLPVPALNSRKPSSSFKVRGSALRLDILTPARAGSEKPIFLPRWNTAAQPLPFLDYLLEEPLPGAVINGKPVFVHVPPPARFAFHKLIIQGERWAGDAARSSKDVHQSGQLFSLLLDDRPGDISLAWDALQKRGHSWVTKARRGLGVLKSIGFPRTEELLNLLSIDRPRSPDRN
ncbi:MAG: nucleotidyltransferase domain-containing protein [Elusimicrobia bacterium]|nr:nucleotidyltransferase domain-containing protein [Elusimicrobiota bacterium]